MFGGPLWKRSPAGLRAWKKRYFVLDPKEGKLLYLDFADAPSKPEDAVGSPKIRGMYRLKEVVKVKWLKDEKNGCRFDVIMRAKKIKVSKSGEPSMADVEVSKSSDTGPSIIHRESSMERSKTKNLNVVQLLAESRSLAKQWTRNIVAVLSKLKSKPGAVKQTTMKSVAEAVSSATLSTTISSDDLASSIATKRRMTAEILKTHWDFSPRASAPSSPRSGSAPFNIAEGGAPDVSELSPALDDGESRDLVHAVAQLLLCNRAAVQAFASDKTQREETEEETKKTDPDAEDLDDPDGLLSKEEGVSGDELDCMSSREFTSKILGAASSGEDSVMSPLGSATSFVFDKDVVSADLTLSKNEFTYYLYQDQSRSFFALESLAYLMRDADHGVFGKGEFGAKVKSAYADVSGETLSAWLMEMGFINTTKRAEFVLQTMMDLKLLIPSPDTVKQFSPKLQLTLSSDLLPFDEETKIRNAVCSKKYLNFLNSISDLDLVSLLLENSSLETADMSKVDVTFTTPDPIAGARYSPPPSSSEFKKVLTPSPFEGNLSRFLMDVSVKFLERVLHYGFEKESAKTDDGLTLILCWKILQRKLSKEHFCADQTKCEICFELETEFNSLCETAISADRFSEHTKNALYKLMFGLDWTIEKVSISAFSQVVITPVPWRCILRNLHRIDNDALVLEILKDTSCLFERRENVLSFQSSTSWMHCFQKILSSYYSRLGSANSWSESVLGYALNSLCLLHFQNFVASPMFFENLSVCCNSLKAIETHGALIPLDLKLLSILCNFIASRRKVSSFVVSFTTTAGYNLQRIVNFVHEKAFTSRLSHSAFFSRKISVDTEDETKDVESHSPLSPKSQKTWISMLPGRISSASPSHSASASSSVSTSTTRDRSSSRETDDFFDNEEVLAVLLDIYSKLSEIYRSLSLNVKSASSYSSDEEKKFFATMYEKYEILDNGEKLLLLLLKAKKVIKRGKARVIVKKFFSKSSQDQKLKVIQHYVEKYSIG